MRRRAKCVVAIAKHHVVLVIASKALLQWCYIAFKVIFEQVNGHCCSAVANALRVTAAKPHCNEVIFDIKILLYLIFFISIYFLHADIVKKYLIFTFLYPIICYILLHSIEVRL